jgi:uncharacterized protein
MGYFRLKYGTSLVCFRWRLSHSWPSEMAAGLVFVTLAILYILPATAGDIYRWRDEGGVLHFSDAPPVSGNADLISSSQTTDPPQAAISRPATYPAESLTGGVFWRIDNGISAPSFLLGTIHSADPRVLQWPSEIDEALQQASSFVMEMELDTDSFFKIGSAMMFTDGQDLADLLGPSDYRRLVAAMASQPLPEAILRKMKPWVLLAMLNQPKSGQGEFMDLRLYRQAMAQGKAVFGLETAEEQLAVFDGLSMDDQVDLLRSTLNHLGELPRMLDQLVDTYLVGDLEAIAALSQSFMKQDGTDLEERFLLRLNDERNNRMVQRMIPRIEQGGAFIAVGALHLTGPAGILRQLEARGFRLSPVD